MLGRRDIIAIIPCKVRPQQRVHQTVLNTIDSATNTCITTHIALLQDGDPSQIYANHRFRQSEARCNPSRGDFDRMTDGAVAWDQTQCSQTDSRPDITCH
jgi:UDP-glucose 4-epimerase